LRQGLARVEEALAARTGWPEARALRAGLLLALAETPARPDEQREWRRQAREDLTAALASNPHLEHTWRPQLSRVQGLATPTP
jgi:hypothetical protein